MTPIQTTNSFEIQQLNGSHATRLKKTADCWERAASDKCKALELNDPRRSILDNCAVISSLVSTYGTETALQNPSQEVYFALDSGEKVQAMMVVALEEEPLEIMELVTNPWNIYTSQKEQEKAHPVKGAGTALVMKALERSLELQRPAVALYSTPEAQGFYEKLGFSKTTCPDRRKSLHLRPMIITVNQIQEIFSRTHTALAYF